MWEEEEGLGSSLISFGESYIQLQYLVNRVFGGLNVSFAWTCSWSKVVCQSLGALTYEADFHVRINQVQPMNN